MQRRRRIGAYGLCRDESRRVLLVRASGSTSGRWLLPGGGVEHGEHPERAVVREVWEETGFRVTVGRPREVLTDLQPLPDIGALRHYDRIIFDVEIVGGQLRDEIGGSSDRALWVEPEAMSRLPLMRFAAMALGRGSAPAGIAIDVDATVPATIGLARQRFAAYGLATDPAGQVLLTQNAQGFPGAGLWHLPGGGTNFGETAVAALERELLEETDQVGVVGELLEASHAHQPAAVGPEGAPIDWHGVRVVYRVIVPEPRPPRVVEAGGSTSEAAWFSPAEALRLDLTEVARHMIAGHLAG